MQVPGFRASGVACGIKPDKALDLALIVSDRPAASAGVYTRSTFPGAPVQVSRPRARSGRARAVIVNSGVANVATGKRGVEDARAMAADTARGLGLRAREVLVASTGVIGWRLPMDRVQAGIPEAVRRLAPGGWGRASRAILTTDTRPKLAERRQRGFTLGGIAKGAGMTMPNMATMLAFLATDLAVEPRLLQDLLEEAVASTFNAFTIDGETSTSDTVVLLANGAAGGRPVGAHSPRARDLRKSLLDLSTELVEKLARNGEGVSKLCDVHVSGARSEADAQRAARSIANSMLVKTALFGADPNWGRVVQAIGASRIRVRPERVGIRIAGVEMLRRGEPVEGKAVLGRAERGMRRRRVAIEVSLGEGRSSAHVLTTDLTYEYVRINAEYTT